MRPWPVAGLVIAAGACAGEPSELGREAAAIRGGVDDATDVAVVGIVDNGSGATCTGTLIARDLVVTAQHCVATVMAIGPCSQGSFGPPRAVANFFVTTRAMLTFNPGDYRPATEIRLPPGAGFCGRDLALLRLGQVVPAAEAAPIAPRLDPAPAAAEGYAAVGYGGTDDNGTGSGQRRRRDGLKVACAGDACASTFMNAAEWRGEAGVCGGDSGGPALDSAGRVLGVASRGAVGCVDPVYTMIAAHDDWLVAEATRAAMLGGYPRPAWAGGPPPIDAGVDADAAMTDDGGCGVARGGGGGGGLAGLVVLAGVVGRGRRRRRVDVKRGGTPSISAPAT